MEVSTPQRSLKTFAKKQGLRGSLQLPTIPSKMGLQKERIDPS
jgi:hypothetical protein